jgi:hypothetical protein
MTVCVELKEIISTEAPKVPIGGAMFRIAPNSRSVVRSLGISSSCDPALHVILVHPEGLTVTCCHDQLLDTTKVVAGVLFDHITVLTMYNVEP